MFFNRKKKIKYHTLDRGLLAEAISISSQPGFFAEREKTINETITLNDVLEIKIPVVHYHWGEYAHYYSMLVMTYVEGIKMAEYRFHLDIRDNKELYRRWECRDKVILHYMPNQFIDLMNEWSRQVVAEYERQQAEIKQKKEDAKKRIHDREEDVLKKYR